MTVMRGRVDDYGGGMVTIVVDRDTMEYPSGDVTIITADEPLLARVLRLLRETAAALDELPPEIRDWRPPALFDVAYVTPDRLRQRAMQIEARATALVKAAAAAWETLRPFAEQIAPFVEAMGKQEPPS